MLKNAIVACADRQQLPAACVALCTARRHAGTNPVSLFAVGEDCGTAEIDALRSFCSVNGIEITFVSFEKKSNVGKERGRGHISSGAYIRLHLDQLLPADLGRVLYIDADTITGADISSLFTMDLGEKVLAAAHEVYVEARIPEFNKHLFNVRRDGYFSSGVMLFDWQKTFASGLLASVRAFAASKPDIRFHDQDCLNYVATGRWTGLDPKYNTVIQHQSAGVKTTIAHFANFEKPWLPNYYMRQLRYRKVYKRLLALTPWSAFVRRKTIIGWFIVLWEPVMWWRQRSVGLEWQSLRGSKVETSA